jgi:hypothetical protein
MEWLRNYGKGQEEDRMPLHLTTDGSITDLPTDKIDRENAARTVITSREEWERIAGGWPLKRLVEIWNSLPGVAAVRKFTSRPIALERIWRALENSEPDVERQNRTKSQKANFREGSKAAQVYALVCRPEGATLREIQEATGWQRHSVRGFLSASIRKQGRRVRSFERAGERVYRIKS